MTKLADKLAEEYKESPTVVKGGLAVAAAGAAAFVLFNEVEIILEVLGVWAAAQFLAKKLLFAEDREKTLAQLKSAPNSEQFDKRNDNV
jgi:chitinase domain-containing protein 1